MPNLASSFLSSVPGPPADRSLAPALHCLKCRGDGLSIDSPQRVHRRCQIPPDSSTWINSRSQNMPIRLQKRSIRRQRDDCAGKIAATDIRVRDIDRCESENLIAISRLRKRQFPIRAVAMTVGVADLTRVDAQVPRWSIKLNLPEVPETVAERQWRSEIPLATRRATDERNRIRVIELGSTAKAGA